MTDDRSYVVRSSFHRVGDIEDVELSVSANGLTRKVLRAEIVDNRALPQNSVKACVVHQKRRNTSDSWEDIAGATLRQTTFGVPSKFPLDSSETRALFTYLDDFYKIGQDGVRPGVETVHITNPNQWIRTDAPRARLIRALLTEDHGTEVWETLIELQPELASQLSAALIHKRRQQALSTFETALGEEHPEEFWRKLLRENSWIFGGANVAIVDESRIDLHHIADIPFEVSGGFMDIVELKKPDFPFWTTNRAGRPWKYRGKFLTPHPELNGAIAQTRKYILQAEKHVNDSDFAADLDGLSHAEVIRWMVDAQEEQCAEWGVEVPTLFGRRLKLIDCQNLFCETDKYARVAHPDVRGLGGRTRIKQEFKPGLRLVKPFFPPKWGLDNSVSRFFDDTGSVGLSNRSAAPRAAAGA